MRSHPRSQLGVRATRGSGPRGSVPGGLAPSQLGPNPCRRKAEKKGLTAYRRVRGPPGSIHVALQQSCSPESRVCADPSWGCRQGWACRLGLGRVLCRTDGRPVDPHSTATSTTGGPTGWHCGMGSVLQDWKLSAHRVLPPRPTFSSRAGLLSPSGGGALLFSLAGPLAWAQRNGMRTL